MSLSPDLKTIAANLSSGCYIDGTALLRRRDPMDHLDFVGQAKRGLVSLEPDLVEMLNSERLELLTKLHFGGGLDAQERERLQDLSDQVERRWPRVTGEDIASLEAQQSRSEERRRRAEVIKQRWNSTPNV